MYRIGQRAAWNAGKKTEKLRVMGEGTWIWEQSEYPWTSSAVINYVQ